MTSLSKICLHWTAGANSPCDTDLKAYHYCVDKYGKIFAGTHRPEDNLNCYDGNYAMHLSLIHISEPTSIETR